MKLAEQYLKLSEASQGITRLKISEDTKKSSKKYTYTAVLKDSGVRLNAELVNGRWLIGGDVYPLNKVSYLIRSDGNQYQFVGGRLKQI